jgi:hypothetical protein
MSNEQPPSQLDVNKAVRVLQGKTLQFTCRILFKTGEEIEFQTDQQVNLAYDDSTRTSILRYDAGGTGYTPVTAWDNVLLFRCEKNPT